MIPRINSVLIEENDLKTVRQSSLLPTVLQKDKSGKLINRLVQRKILYLLKKENSRFSAASLLITRKIWN